MPRAFEGEFDIFKGEFRVVEIAPRGAYRPDPTTMLGADTALGTIGGRGGRALGAGRGGIHRSSLFAGGSGRRWG